MGSKVKQESRHWFGRTIPYIIDDSVNNLRKFIAGDITTPVAIQIIQMQTHLRCVNRTNQSDYISFVNGQECSSKIGRQGGAQRVNLNKDTCDSSGVVVHEIAHAIGMFHEQSRLDRDQFVNVHWENIEKGKEHNFEKYGSNEGSEYGLYDFSSVMHYTRCTFGRAGYYWTTGWTTVLNYAMSGAQYLFFPKASGFGSDGNNGSTTTGVWELVSPRTSGPKAGPRSSPIE